MPHDEALARAALIQLGMKAAGLSPLGSGFASEVWEVRRGKRAFALRMARTDIDWPCTYKTEHAVMARLAALRAPVPTPVAGSWDEPSWDGPPYSLTTLVPGTPLQPDTHEAAAPRIAAFLRQMHSIRPSGFGPPDADVELTGLESTPEAGVRAWWGSDLWPFSSPTLASHPALRDQARLAAAIEARGPLVHELALEGPAVLVHTDLHDENILQSGETLGFIDFGETFVGSARWEFAALAYFLGWSLMDATLAAYLDPSDDLDTWRSDVAAVALSFGAGRWQQDRRMGIENEAHNQAFLREAIERI